MKIKEIKQERLMSPEIKTGMLVEVDPYSLT
jgi:hypothetical protein